MEEYDHIKCLESMINNITKEIDFTIRYIGEEPPTDKSYFELLDAFAKRIDTKEKLVKEYWKRVKQ